MHSQIDISQFPALRNISVRGRGYLEAFAKILEGQRLIDAGTLELRQLDGSGGKSLSGEGGVDVTDTVMRLSKPIDVGALKDYLKDGPLASGELAARIGCNPDTVRRALLEDGEVQRIGVGSQSKWELREGSATKRVPPKTIAPKVVRRPKKDPNFGVEAPRCKLVLEAVQKDPWFTTHRLTKEILRNHKTVVRVCDLLQKAGMLWKVEKTHNPAHTGMAHVRSQFYWTADPDAKIDVVNMHVPRAQVRNPEDFFPAVEEAIKAGNGWAGKKFIEKYTGLSFGPLRRVLEAMERDKLVKTVEKKNNPNHREPKNFNRMNTYWELRV